ncbi:MAG TPA: hypothetical protein VMD05_03965 [Candidatus Nanoarchaeia archaeon]|nr:hypothetical protein [Candidatus Nanoarchaeia archaeon]
MKRVDNLRDVFKGLKHSKACAKYCPRCGSPDLTLSSSMDYWLTPQKYLCGKCGYFGSVYMELEKEEEK